MGGVHSISGRIPEPRGRTPRSDRRCRARSPARSRPRMPTASSRARHRAVTAAAPPEGVRCLAAVRARPRRDVLPLRRAARRRASLLRPRLSRTRARAELARPPSWPLWISVSSSSTSRGCLATAGERSSLQKCAQALTVGDPGSLRVLEQPVEEPQLGNRSCGVTLRNNARAKSPRDQRLRVGVRYDSQRYHRVQAGTVYKE